MEVPFQATKKKEEKTTITTKNQKKNITNESYSKIIPSKWRALPEMKKRKQRESKPNKNLALVFHLRKSMKIRRKNQLAVTFDHEGFCFS